MNVTISKLVFCVRAHVVLIKIYSHIKKTDLVIKLVETNVSRSRPREEYCKNYIVASNAFYLYRPTNAGLSSTPIMHMHDCERGVA